MSRTSGKRRSWTSASAASGVSLVTDSLGWKRSTTGSASIDALSRSRAEALLDAVRHATTQRCADESWVHVVVDGTSLRIADRNQQWWVRARGERRYDCADRNLDEKETQHWVNAIVDAAIALDSARTKPWFQIDREGDRYWILKAPQESV